MSKLLGMLLVLVVTFGMFYAALVSYLNMPIVAMSTSRNVAVSCVTPEHGEQDATTAVCQEVLKGKFEVEWVK